MRLSCSKSVLGDSERLTLFVFINRVTEQVPEGDNPSSERPTILHGTLKEHAARLTALNNAGHGIFVMINQGDLKGRTARNVTRVRALFVDSDNGPIQPLLEAAITPHIAVESSPGKGHGYFLVDDCPLDSFRERQHALAQRFNGDHAVCDLSRVMRLPGFFYLKGAARFQTRLIKPANKGQQ